MGAPTRFLLIYSSLHFYRKEVAGIPDFYYFCFGE